MNYLRHLLEFARAILIDLIRIPAPLLFPDQRQERLNPEEVRRWLHVNHIQTPQARHQYRARLGNRVRDLAPSHFLVFAKRRAAKAREARALSAPTAFVVR
jgi:hypothetical protein